jgi:hypothetical protein
MGYVVVILVILMAVGSILWLKPSPAQQRQARLRLLARELGIDVRLCSLPQCRRARVREERPEQGVVYRLPVFDPAAANVPHYLLCRDSAAAPWSAEIDAPLVPALQSLVDRVCANLPPDAAALELGPAGPAVYWRERGDEDVLRRLYKSLEDLRSALLGESP